MPTPKIKTIYHDGPIGDVVNMLPSNIRTMTVFEIIKNQVDFKKIFGNAFDEASIPRLTDDQPINKKRMKIRTIERIKPTEYSFNIQVAKPEFIRLYIVFDYNNQIKSECLTGTCVLSPVDSIAAVSIALPSKNAISVDWFMELSNPVYKHIRNISQYYTKNLDGKYASERVTVENSFQFLSWQEMTNPTTVTHNSDAVYRVPSAITSYLSEDNLIGHYERKPITTMLNSGGRSIPSTEMKLQWVPGILEKLEDPTDTLH